jgi:hypothetical protein
VNDETLLVRDPFAIGVPEINPVELRVRPAGSAPVVIAQRYGVCPPVAWS